MSQSTIHQTLSNALAATKGHPNAQLFQTELKTVQGCIARIKVTEARTSKAQKATEAVQPQKPIRPHNPAQQ
ncbi:MAG: hypothetical protein AAFN10_27960 [Bacteroidota bacterium]